MNRITKINPVIAPQAHAEIAKRCLESSNGTAVFKGLCYEITVGGEVWHIGRGTQTFENNWDDVTFGLETPVKAIETPVKAKFSAKAILRKNGFRIQKPRREGKVFVSSEFYDCPINGTYECGRVTRRKKRVIGRFLRNSARRDGYL